MRFRRPSLLVILTLLCAGVWIASHPSQDSEPAERSSPASPPLVDGQGHLSAAIAEPVAGNVQPPREGIPRESRPADPPQAEPASPNVWYKRVHKEPDEPDRPPTYPVLDDDWLAHGTRVTSSRNQALALDPEHGGGFVVRVAGGPSFYSLGSLPPAFLLRQLRLEDCVLQARVTPDLDEVAQANVRVNVQPASSHGLQLVPAGLQCFAPPADLAPVYHDRSYSLPQAECVTDLHPGTDYTLWVEEPESALAPERLRTFVDRDIRTPASVLVPWTYPDSLTVVLSPPADRVGDLMMRIAGQDRFLERGTVQGGKAVVLTQYLPEGTLEVGAKGAGWMSTGPAPRVEVLNGKPSVTRIELPWNESVVSAVTYLAPAQSLHSPHLGVWNGDGKVNAYEEFSGFAPLGSHAWSGSTLTINDLSEPVEFFSYFPRSGDCAWISLAPGQRVEVPVEVYPRRVFAAARQVAKDWAEDPGVLGSYCSIDRNVAKPGEEPHWLQVHQENTRLPDAFDDGTWVFAWDRNAEYRVRLSPRGLQAERIREL